MTEETLNQEAHEHEEHWHPPYWGIFFVLLALTVAEMALAFTPPSIFGLAILLMIVIGVIKIAYIARYFMHLKFDQKILGYIASAPLVFASFMAIGLLLEFS